MEKVSTKKVVVSGHDRVVARQNIRNFTNPVRDSNDPEGVLFEQKVMQRDLFLRGFAKLKSRPIKDPLSFFQIAAIHGLPYTPYDGVTSPSPSKTGKPPNKKKTRGKKQKVKPDTREETAADEQQWMGYCEHGSVLFPTWHRPYMMLIEQAIIGCALEIIDKYSNNPNKEAHTEETKEALKKAARDIRLPYWDWADDHSLTHGVPECFTLEHVTVEYPEKDTFRNPLLCYVVPENIISPFHDYNSPEMIPTSKPHYAPDSVDVPFTPAYHATVRHPTPEYLSNVTQLNNEVTKQCSVLLQPSVRGMFNTKLWSHFSNHNDHDDEKTQGSSLRYSLEFVHDNLHNAVGGQAGHMASVEVAAFDPIFFFHHTNVDRLCALWQVAHPDAWIEPDKSHDGTRMKKPNTEDTENSPLYPFRRTAAPREEFWTSKQVRYVTNLGYTYPEIEKYDIEKISPTQAKEFESRMKSLYAPKTIEKTYPAIKDDVIVKSSRIRATKLESSMMGLMYTPMTIEKTRVYLTVSGVDKFAFNGSYQLLIYVGCTINDVFGGKETREGRYFAMSVGIFSRGKINKCRRCHDNVMQEKRMIFTVDITATVDTLGIDTSKLPRIESISAGGQSCEESPNIFETAVVAETKHKRLHEMKGISKHVYVEDSE